MHVDMFTLQLTKQGYILNSYIPVVVPVSTSLGLSRLRGMLQGKCPHGPMAIHYLFICWSMGCNYSSSLTENALLIQCCGGECGMKDDFQPLQLAAASSQESPRNPARLQRSQLVSPISYLGYRPTHSSDGNSGQLGGNLVPRPIVLLLGILHGCWDCSMWGNLQIQS